MLASLAVASALMLPALADLHPPQGAATCFDTVKASPPTTVKCNRQGALRQPSTPLSTSQNVPDVETCAAQCTDNTQCQAISYGNTTETCNLYSVNLLAQQFRKSSTSGIYYSNIRCFQPYYYPTSAIVNGNFNTGALDPWDGFYAGQEGAYASISLSQQSLDGSAYSAYLMTSSQTSLAYAVLHQSFVACNTTTYTLTFDYEVTSGQNTANCGSYFKVAVNSATKIFFQQYNDLTNANQVYSPTYTFTVPRHANINLNYELIQTCAPASMNILLDNVVLTASNAEEN